MEVQRSQSDVQPELAYPAEPARSGVMSWKAPLAAIAGGTTSSVSFRRAAAASESILRPISLSLDFRRDCPSSCEDRRIRLCHFLHMEILPMRTVTRLAHPLLQSSIRRPNTYPCRNLIWLTCGHPCPCFYRKNLYTAPLAAGHMPGTEALRASISSNPVSITSADLRRPSSVSQMSGVENSALNAGAGGSSDSLEGHVPHLICKCNPRCTFTPDPTVIDIHMSNRIRIEPHYHMELPANHDLEFENKQTRGALPLRSPLLPIVLILRLCWPSWAMPADACFGQIRRSARRR